MMTTATVMVPQTVKVRILQEECPESPREWDNLGTMACWHNRYNLGDIQPKQSPEEWLAENAPEGSVVLPLYLYDHSGITMRTNAFSCPWDSGQVGYIVATPEAIRKEFSCKRISKKLRAKVEKILMQEVKIYDDFITGCVYSYIIETEDGEYIDSCGGFYGDDLSGMQYHAGDEYKDALAKAWRAM